MPVVTLLAGKNKTPFHVHMDVISAVSPSFKSAFTGAGTSAFERLITLPQDRSSTINHLADWLYSKNLPYDRESLDTNGSD